jgi:rfaE bifunctional protein nucleotidyltransferase chain/domain
MDNSNNNLEILVLFEEVPIIPQPTVVNVGVNTDASVRILGKGDDRPLNIESDRLALLAALESVDLVVLFTEPTPVELMAKIKPDIYVKGGDYEIDALAETALVKSWSGKAYAIPFIHDRSTTALLRKIRS